MTSHGIIESNLLLRTSGIQLEPHYAFWREAGWVEDVVLRNNRLLDTGRGPESYSPYRSELGAISVVARKENPKSSQPFFNGNRGIVIESNTIDGCSVAGIYVRCATNVTIRHNTISRVNLVNAPRAGSAVGLDVREPIDARGIANATIKGNRVIGNSP